LVNSLTVQLADGKTLSWSLDFSGRGTLQVPLSGADDAPLWTRLDFFQCPECTLDPRENPTCPVAEVLARFARDVGERDSFENTDVLVEEDDGRRVILRDVPLQSVAGELVRLAVFQSGCPIGRKLKPAMVRLRPFPTRDEIVQSFAIFFALQSAGARQGMLGNNENGEQTAAQFMNSLHDVFGFLAKRLEHAGQGDVYINAVVIIDSLSLLFALSAPELIRKCIDEYRFW